MDLAVYAGLFANAAMAATLVPLPSEPALVALLATGTGDPAVLFAAATVGNTLGSSVNFLLGRGVERFRDRSWFPVTQDRYAAACRSFGRWGLWSLPFAWLPFIGDPLTVAAGALRVPFATFLVLVGIGKAARYGMIVGGMSWWAG